MAAVDKIYGTTEQYDEFKDWLTQHKPEFLKYLYLRGTYEEKEEKYRPISNFPEEADMWLLEHCPFMYIINRIKEQHNLE